MMDPNFRAQYEFRERWGHLANPRQWEIGRFVISAVVTFKSPRFDKEDLSEVTINCFAGPSDGQVSITETHILNSGYLHLDFTPKWQDFDFDDSSGALVVRGSSAKVGGDYTVLIQPEE